VAKNHVGPAQIGCMPARPFTHDEISTLESRLLSQRCFRDRMLLVAGAVRLSRLLCASAFWSGLVSDDGEFRTQRTAVRLGA